ncbi:MAG: 50S ribosomal protein L23 [Nitrospirota bacterium]|nr:50S ribosomal protein L23 [Nitrospiria bacterium]
MSRSPYDILIKPLLTEKMTALKESENRISFVVDKRANKIEVKKAVEEAFKVKVAAVNVMNLLGKKKRLGKFAGKRPDWKKAIITLKKGEKLELFEGM